MAVDKPIGGNPVKNNGGKVVKAGNTDGSVVGDLPLVTLAADDAPNGTVVIEGATLGTTKALTSGTFSYQPAKGTEFLLRIAGDNANKINGTLSTVLSVGGVENEYVWDGIMELNSTRKLDDGSLIAFGDDNAAGPVEPNRGVPGQLVYMSGSKTPFSDDYKAKDTAES